MLSRKCEVDEYSMGLAKGFIIEHANMRTCEHAKSQWDYYWTASEYTEDMMSWGTWGER